MMNMRRDKFLELFGNGEEPQVYFCPGRVNLIGEHIDYLGGLVLPAAISLGITALIRKSESRSIRIHSNDFDQTISIELEKLPIEKQNDWNDYVVGVILHLQASGIQIQGFDLLLDSSLPKGSGLSSSAALEVLVYYALTKTFAQIESDRIQMALDCQSVENNFIGVNCGIMDQFAVANGKKDHALMLNCDTVEFVEIPMDLGDHELLIINTNKPRQLAESAYNQRRSECNEALKILRQVDRSISNLVDAKADQLQLIENEVIRKRAKHALTEQQRVIASSKALKDANLKQFGQLLNQSHASLRDDYEVSCDELDFLVNELQRAEGCLGARMTGAGFGGCCIALMDSSYDKNQVQILFNQYKKRFDLTPSLYACQIAQGVSRVA